MKNNNHKWVDSWASISFHGCEDGVEFFPLDSELLEVVNGFVLAFCRYFLYLEPEVLKELVHVNIPFQNEYAPPVTPWMFAGKESKNLQVNKSQVVHFSVYFADVDSKNSQFVPVHTVKHKSQVDLDFELSLEDNSGWR